MKDEQLNLAEHDLAYYDWHEIKGKEIANHSLLTTLETLYKLGLENANKNMTLFDKILKYFKRKFCRHEFEELFSYSYYKENDIRPNPTGKVILRACKKCGWMEKIHI